MPPGVALDCKLGAIEEVGARGAGLGTEGAGAGARWKLRHKHY